MSQSPEDHQSDWSLDEEIPVAAGDATLENDQELDEMGEGGERSLDAHDLFGNDSDDGRDVDDLQDVEREDLEELKRIEMNVTLPEICFPAAKSNLIYLAKIPHFLHFSPKPFDATSYSFESESASTDTTKETNEEIKLRIHNTIRWRYAKDETNRTLRAGRKESNARFVRWSDNSMSLMVGTEYFDATELSLQAQHQYLVKSTHPLLPHHPSPSAAAKLKTKSPAATSAPVEPIFMQIQTKLSLSLGFRPSSTTSSTHTFLKKNLHKKHKKVNKTKLFHSLHNPEAAKRKAEQVENEIIRNKKKLENRRRGAGGGAFHRELTVAGLEEEEYDEMENTYVSSKDRSRDVDEYEKDGFVVNDEEMEFFDQSDDDLFGDKEDEERENLRDAQILQAKRSSASQEILVEEASGAVVDKRRRLIFSDDEDQ